MKTEIAHRCGTESSNPAPPSGESGTNRCACWLCCSYAQDLADKLARDTRGVMVSSWYRQIFPTRLAPHRRAVHDQVDSTAQFLDWIKTPIPNSGIYELARRRWEAAQQRAKPQPIKPTFAPGCMEWLAEQEKQKTAG